MGPGEKIGSWFPNKEKDHNRHVWAELCPPRCPCGSTNSPKWALPKRLVDRTFLTAHRAVGTHRCHHVHWEALAPSQAVVSHQPRCPLLGVPTSYALGESWLPQGQAPIPADHWHCFQTGGAHVARVHHGPFINKCVWKLGESVYQRARLGRSDACPLSVFTVVFGGCWGL